MASSWSFDGSSQRAGRSSHSYAGRSSPPPADGGGSLYSGGRGVSSGGGGGKRQWVEVSGVEQGVVASVKDGKYAFINCADREGPELFFHLSDLADPAGGIQRGDEVSFVVCCEAASDPTQAAPQPARYFAKRVSRLAPGSVSFERVDETAVRGVVEAELKRPSRGQRGAEGYGGRVRRAAPEGSSGGSAGTLEFAERDLVGWPCLPAVGDVVVFDVFTERRSGRQGATAVRLVALNPAGRQRGTVAVLKDGYGFIRAEDAPPGGRELFFHFSALLDTHHPPALGDELEFDTQRDEQPPAQQQSGAAHNRLSAQRITALPKGTIKRDTVAPDKLVGVVERDLLADQPPPSGGELNGSSAAQGSSASAAPSASSFSVRRSTIRYDPSSPSSAPSASSPSSVVLEFASSDCRDARPILLRGDVVSFQLLTRGKSGEQRPVNVALQHPTSEGREQGKVVSVNAQGGFAFIRRAAREGELFMHATNYKPAAADGEGQPAAGGSFVAEGTEVEFSVWVADNGRLCAVRGLPLPPGTVHFERLLDGLYRGAVSREPRRPNKGKGAIDRQRSGGDRDGDERGEIRITHCVDGETRSAGPLPAGTAPFVASFSASSHRLPLLVGDAVDCRVAVHNLTGAHMARDVSLQQLRASPPRECGVVQQVPAANGRGGRVACQHPAGAQLPFESRHFVDAAQAAAVAVGDSVQFDCVELPAEASRRSSSGAGKTAVAARLSLLPAGSVQLDAIDRSVRCRGRVEDMPSNPKSSKQTAGHILLLSTHAADSATPAVPNNASAAASSAADAASDASAVSAPLSALSIASPSSQPSASASAPSPSPSPALSWADALLGSLVEFRFRDIVGNSFLAKGDPVEFSLLAAQPSQPSDSAPAGPVRAAEVSLLPLQATVASLPGQSAAAEGGGSGGKASKSSFGLLSILPVSTASANATSAASAAASSPSVPPASASFLDESCVFAASDVLGGARVAVGDLVSIGGMHFSHERKRRQARAIQLVKAAPRSQQQPGQQSAGAERRSKQAAASGGAGGVALLTMMRFARGPDDTRGFTGRRGDRQQGVSIGLQRAATASAAPANAAQAAPETALASTTADTEDTASSAAASASE